MKTKLLFLMALWMFKYDTALAQNFGSPSQTIVIDVGDDVRVWWLPVELNADSTKCMDLEGYKVYANNIPHDTKDTTYKFYDVREATTYWVVAYDTVGNMSEKSNVVLVTLNDIVLPDTIHVYPDTTSPEAPKIWIEVIGSDTSFSWSAKDLIQFGGEGSYSDFAGLGRYGLYQPLIIPVDIGKVGVYKLEVNCSGKAGSPILSVNGITIGGIELNKIKTYSIRFNLLKGKQTLVFSATNNMWFFGQAITLKLDGSKL